MSFFFQGMPGMGGMGGFPGMGGMGGMGGDDENGGNEEIENKKYYEILGVKKDASDQDIKKAYRKLARDLHPDRHPEDPQTYQQKFQDLQAAYEVLSDPDKRKLYDRFGEQGLRGGSGGGGMGDIFDMFFSGGGGGRRSSRSQRDKRAPPIKVALDVTLEDLYIGASKKISFKRFLKCGSCDGKGGSQVIECNECNGKGVQIIMQRMGYMTMQTQRQCPHCDGEGQKIREGDKCKKCDGKGLKEENKEIDFNIPIGGKHADQVILKGQGHELPGTPAGDILIILRCEKHEIFQRIGADLAMTYELTLKEALCGYDIKIPHLSRATLHLKSKKGEICQSGQLKVIYGKGMPQKGAATKGNLYIKFEVIFPKSNLLSKEIVENISKILPNESIKQEFEQNIDIDIDMKNKEDDNNKHNKSNKSNKHNHKKNDDNNDNNDENDENDEIDENDDYEIFIEQVEATNVQGEPEVTPASAKSTYDEDEQEQEGVQCRQM